MGTTNITCKVTEAALETERQVRRWVGVPLEIRVAPQRDGLCVLTIQTPSGVDTPTDPGAHPLQDDLDAALNRWAEVSQRLVVMTGARDASDAEVERLRGQLEELGHQLNAARAATT